MHIKIPSKTAWRNFVQLSEMKTSFANLASKQQLAVSTLQQKLKDARAALRSQHSAEVPTDASAALVPMPHATMPLTPVSAPANVIDVEVEPEFEGQLSVIPGRQQNFIHLEEGAEQLENELATAESHLEAFIQELDASGSMFSLKGTRPHPEAC
jgi:hypothetical protein